MQIVPTSLVRISRYYMITAVGYLLLTLAIGVVRALTPIPDSLIHWAPAVLGWVTFPIMGAFYQFFPTLQGRDLRWENLTLPQFALMNVGVLGLMGAAWMGNGLALSIGAAIYTAGALLFAAIILLANLDLSKVVLTLRFYVAALAYFVVAVMLFFAKTIGVAPPWATNSLVLHVIAFGWAITAIMGAEYSMVPMLQLKDLQHPRLADAQFFVVNAGFLGLAFSLATGELRLVATFGLAALIGILIFAYIILSSLQHGPSRLPRLDISVKYFLVGIAYLVVTSVLGILIGAFGWINLTPIHLHLGLIGVVTMTIIGAMYHVLPFVIWWEVYAPKLGYEDVPLLRQLYSEHGAQMQLYGANAGLILMLVGFAVGTRLLLALGGAVLIVTAVAFALAMIKVIGHRKNLDKSVGHQETKTAYGRTL